MGQKANPIGLRLGINKTWDSCWYANKRNYAKLLHEDLQIRSHIIKNLKNAEISKIGIERSGKKVKLKIYTAKPGMVIGKKGSDIEKVQKNLAKITLSEVHLNIVEIRKPEIDALLVAQNLAGQLEKRVSFRRAMKKLIQNALKAGAEGIRINCSGRLGGAEIARMEWYREGRVPLHTLRANIDYGIARANTTYGVIGIKVWIFKGENSEQDSNISEVKTVNPT